MNGRERMLAACRGETVDRTPVWIMRQAGRYLPEYRAVRERAGFWDMVRTPELAAEVTLQPIRRFGMDAAILFSDILVVPDALGVDVRYEEGGPQLSPHVRTAEQVAALKPVDPDAAFAYMGRAIELLCEALHPHTAVIGFAGAPFTLAAYMVEGGPSKDVLGLKVMARRDRPLFDALMGRIADTVAGLLRVQVEAGADLVQVFDTWAIHLSPDDYAELALPYTRRVVQATKALGVPLVCYVRGAAGLLEEAAKSGCDVLSIDPSIRLSDARRRLPATMAIQGNFDPSLVFAPPDRIRQVVRQGIADAAGGGYIANLGQGLVPSVPIEGVDAFVRAVVESGAQG